MAHHDAERVYAPIDEAALHARLDRSLSPRGPAMLLDRAAALGLGPGDLVLDVGGRDGRHARALILRFGCRAVVLDVVAANLPRAGRSPVSAALASMSAIPLADGTCRLVWSRDMLLHVPDLGSAMRECARILSPGGHVLVHNTFATPLLEPGERTLLVETLGIVPENLSAAFAEDAFARAGLAIVERDPIGSEWREHSEETGEAITSRQLLRIARMRRDRARLVAELGQTLYDVELADCLWGVYQMIGKLGGVVYTLASARV